MSSEVVPLSKFCIVRKGLSYKGEYIYQEGPALLGIGTIREGGGFRPENVRSYGGPYKKEHVLNPGDIYIALTSQDGFLIGSPAMVPKDFNGFGITTHHDAKIDWKTENQIMKDFIFWLMHTYEFIQHCINFSVGTTVYATHTKDVERFLVSKKLSKNQKMMTKILNNIFELERIKNSIKDNLESQIKILFRSWFIDFEPVNNILKKKQSDGIDKEIVNLFPNSFEMTKFGKVPTGWKYTLLQELAELKIKTLNPQEMPNEKFFHYSIPAFDNGSNPILTLGIDIKSNKLIVPDNCVLLSKLNPKFNRVWIPNLSTENVSIASTEFLPWIPKNGVSTYYLYSLMISQPFRWSMDSRVSGTTNSHQRVNPGNCAKIPCIKPSIEVMNKFHESITPLFEQINTINDTQINLNGIRNLLLLKLNSGNL
jgi:type I restriction enzyme S subunit